METGIRINILCLMQIWSLWLWS